MTTVTDDDLLRDLIARLRDPDQVVLNPQHMYENGDGAYSYGAEPQRGCVIALAQRSVKVLRDTTYASLDDFGEHRGAIRDAAQRFIENEVDGPGAADLLEAHLKEAADA